MTRPGGLRTVVAESVLVRHQLLILNRGPASDVKPLLQDQPLANIGLRNVPPCRRLGPGYLLQNVLQLKYLKVSGAAHSILKVRDKMRIWLGILLVASSALFAGDLRGKKELSGFGGGEWIQDIGTMPYVGGSFGAGLSSRALLFGEYAYVRVGDGGISLPPGVSVSSHLHDFQGGLKFNLVTSARVEPYAIVGAGAGRFSVEANSAGFSASTSNTSFGLHLGLGARVYVSSKWGIQPEFKYGHYFGDVDQDVVRFGAGIFYQW